MVKLAFETTFKLMLAGDERSGKGKIVENYTTSIHNPAQRIKIGVKWFIKDLALEGNLLVRLQMWDFGGEERFRFLLPTYVNGSNGALLFYNITDLGTLNSLDEWLKILRSYDKKVPILLVGTNAERQQDRQIQYVKAVELAKSKLCRGYVEISTETGFNVEEMFQTIAQMMWKYTIKLKRRKK
jgi:small GTP-binding protein